MQRVDIRRTLNILVIGETGSGKTHLINTLFGDLATPAIGPDIGTQNSVAIECAWRYLNIDYQVKMVDTRGILDRTSNVRNLYNTFMEIIDKLHLRDFNYIFICIKNNRYMLSMKDDLEHIFTNLNQLFAPNTTNDSKRIKIFFTHCDGWTAKTKDDFNKSLKKLDIYSLISKYDIYCIGSFIDSNVDENLRKLNTEYKNNTRNIVAEICSNPNNIIPKPIDIPSSCSIS